VRTLRVQDGLLRSPPLRCALGAYQLSSYIHSFVQDSNNLNLTLTKRAIKYYVATVGELSIAWFNKIAVAAGLTIFGKHMKRIIELFCIRSTLSLTPTTLRVDRYRFQVSFSGVREGK
jgi:hypothetical protein